MVLPTTDTGIPVNANFYNTIGDCHNNQHSSVTTTGGAETASMESNANGCSDGISTGTAVGIGVDSALGALLLAGTPLFLFIRRRNARRNALDGHGPVELGGSAGDPTGYDAIPPHPARFWKPKDHVGGGMVYEMQSETRVPSGIAGVPYLDA